MEEEIAVGKRHWFMLLTPVVIQSAALIGLSSRFQTTSSRVIILVLGFCGLVSAAWMFALIFSQERYVSDNASVDWAERLGFILQKSRNDTMNDLEVINGWLKLGEARRVQDYLGQIGRRISEDAACFRWFDPRVAFGILTGKAVAAADAIDMRVEFEQMESRAPFCEGLHETLERLISSLSAQCKKSGSGNLHVKCTQKAQRWQIKIMCSALVPDSEADRLLSRERSPNRDFNIRSAQEIDKGLVLTIEFPKRAERRMRQGSSYDEE